MTRRSRYLTQTQSKLLLKARVFTHSPEGLPPRGFNFMDNKICGVHAVYEALASRGRPLERIHIARDAHSPKLKDILNLAHERSVPVRKEERVILDRMAQGAVHQGIIAIASAFEYSDFEVLFKSEKPLVIVLDGVEDPHNLGAVIRTAEACKASGVVVPERHSAPLTPTVVKASAGASAYVPVVRVKNLVAAIDEMKKRGLWIVGVDPAGTQDWTDFDYTGPIAWFWVANIAGCAVWFGNTAMFWSAFRCWERLHR